MPQHASAPFAATGAAFVDRPRVVSLIRVSTAEQAADGRAGILRQEAAIQVIIAREALDCVGSFRIIDVSGSDVRRDPQMVQILAMLDSKQVEGVVCDALDRLFRPTRFEDFALLQPFQNNNAKIWTTAQTFEPGSLNGILLSGLHAVLAGNELATIRARVDGAKEAKRRHGKCPTNALTLPLGVSVHPKTRELFYNSEIERVRELFRLFLEEGVRNYAELHRRTGIGAVTARNLLTNPIYTGWRVYSQRRGKKLVSRSGKTYRRKEARAESDVVRVKVLTPIISEEAFTQIQEIVSRTRYNHASRRKSGEHCHLGTGIARCGYCDEPLYCSSTRSRGNRRGYYTCKRNYYVYRQKSGGCPQCNLREQDVDRAIFEFATRTLTDPERLANIIQASLQRVENVVTEFPADQDPEAEITALLRKERRLVDAYEAESITVDELRERRKLIQTRIARLRSAPRRAKRRDSEEVERLIEAVVEGATALSSITETKDRKEIVAALFDEVCIKDRSIIAFRLDPELSLSSCNLRHVLDAPFRIGPELEALPAGMRRCSSCNQVQSSERFRPKQGQCRACVAERSHMRYLRRKKRADRAADTPP